LGDRKREIFYGPWSFHSINTIATMHANLINNGQKDLIIIGSCIEGLKGYLVLCIDKTSKRLFTMKMGGSTYKETNRNYNRLIKYSAKNNNKNIQYHTFLEFMHIQTYNNIHEFDREICELYPLFNKKIEKYMI
jgi:TPP-dependent 2-oxoacid decarboxylase